MKRFLLRGIMILALTCSLVAAGSFFALGHSTAAGVDDACADVANAPQYCQTYKDPKDPMDTFKNVVNVITFFGGFIAILWIIFMGIKMATSSGDAQKVSSARNGIIYASVGLLVMVIAQVVIKLLLRNVG